MHQYSNQPGTAINCVSGCPKQCQVPFIPSHDDFYSYSLLVEFCTQGSGQVSYATKHGFVSQNAAVTQNELDVYSDQIDWLMRPRA